MDISAINRGIPAIAAPTSAAPVENSASTNRDVVQAVKALNGAEMFGENELTFQKDAHTHQMVIRVVNKKTQDVVLQIPPQYVLELAQDLKRNHG